MPVPAGFQPVARLADVEPAVPVPVTLDDGRPVCLVRDGDAVYAIEDRCSHRDFPLSGGDVVDACILECPWHGARFDVRSGLLAGGPGLPAIATYPVHLADGLVYISAVATAPTS